VGTSRRDLFRAAAKAARDAAVAAQEPPVDLDRYGRQLLVDEWGKHEQRRLQDASVLVVGAGALGSPVATYLVGAGVGRIGILDSDLIELSNLHRQYLHYTPDVGAPKVQSAIAKLQFLNPDVEVVPYQVRIGRQNAGMLLHGHNLVVDCSDSFETRYTVNDACVAAGVPLVEGGVVAMSGIVMSIVPRSSACYRCAFPTEPANAPTCASAGVLGPAAGVIGSLMALEAMKLIGGLRGSLQDALLQVDLADYSVTRVATDRRADCPACG
jgi:molybdopterin-synthase adenylyltransferase